MICLLCRAAADEGAPSLHRECQGKTSCDCQHMGSFPCGNPDCTFVAASIKDMDEHVDQMMLAADFRAADAVPHGERR